ncbi:MAG: hypothetical protein ACK4IS_12030 [Erythrobacter sp.]
MIDYFALALGHGLLALALLRLAMRGDVDADPLIASLSKAAAARRKHPPRKSRAKGAATGDLPAAPSPDDAQG